MSIIPVSDGICHFIHTKDFIFHIKYLLDHAKWVIGKKTATAVHAVQFEGKQSYLIVNNEAHNMF